MREDPEAKALRKDIARVLAGKPENKMVTAAKKTLSSVRKHVGRRGAFLVFLTVLDVSYGYALLTTPVSALASRLDLFLPLQAWGWIWLCVGIVLLSGVPFRRDVPQFALAALLKAAWGGLYADAWLIQASPRAWISVVVWLSFALTVLLIAGWPEPHYGQRVAREI